MFRISVWICLSLLVNGYSAKPFKSWGKASETAVQETLMSDEMEEKQLSDLGLKQVEAPEDMDRTDYIDSAIWKNIIEEKGDEEEEVEKGELEEGQGRYLTAEEDTDHINHPSMDSELTGSQPQLQDTFVGVLDTQQPEQDRLYHPEIKQDDWLYQASEPHKLVLSALGAEFRGHREPEEDRDHIYHGDLPGPIQGGRMDQERQLPADRPSQRIHSQPEEDLDDLYHP
ncbi:uncharacterized protein si:ch211-217g15.3 [Esox lucius]|uniref:uncharacterized protein si:ch211-217g15.3 n=1 Tax=Esox lucius TaxID=8010 RepID=UPI0005777A59|nr:uncharacterized protein si:ch211-217g15.3 [Esox lucius]